MSTWQFEETIEGPFDSEPPLELVTTFYRANGYEPLDEESRRVEDETENRRVLSRGEEGASWWSSTMTELRAEIELRQLASSAQYPSRAIEITYEVETSGQYMTDSDRRFWKREIDMASSYLDHPDGDPRDLRPMEDKRAERMEHSRIRYAFWGSAAAFILVLVFRTVGCA